MYNSGFSSSFECSYGLFNSFWGFGSLLLVIGVLAFLYFKKANRKSSHKNALASLNMRFASGEVTEKDYLSKKRVLTDK